MDFLDLARQRYSVRKFTDKKVEKDKIDLILEAARLAPTAVNYQPQRILVIEDVKQLDKLKKCTTYHFNAPLAFLICYDNAVSWKSSYGKDEGDMDASIVTTHMMFEITQLGLGTTWVGSFDMETLKKEFAIPDFLVPVAILPTGYPVENSRPSRMHNQSITIEEMVFFDTFDKIIPGESNEGKH